MTSMAIAGFLYNRQDTQRRDFTSQLDAMRKTLEDFRQDMEDDRKDSARERQALADRVGLQLERQADRFIAELDKRLPWRSTSGH